MDSRFSDSEWADPQRSGYYRDTADHYIVDRSMQLFMLQSFFRHTTAEQEDIHVLDLGCGDGILTRALLDVNSRIQVTLIDGAIDMLGAARTRLAGYDHLTFVHQSFDDFSTDTQTAARYHFVVSAFAIHHLYLDEKIRLFRSLYRQLKPDGSFMNIDTVMPELEAHESWYRQFWKEWIIERQSRLSLEDDFSSIPEEAKLNPDNKLSTLNSQLAGLTSIGFTDVGCHYQNGVFAIYSGRKPE